MAAFGVVGGYLALQLLSYGSQKEDALALGGGFLLFAQLGGSAVLVYGLFKGSTGPPVPPDRPPKMTRFGTHHTSFLIGESSPLYRQLR